MRRSAWAILVVLAWIGWHSVAAAPASPAVYIYRVQHPRYGDIGTYINNIVPRPDGVLVQTRVRVAVKLAYVTLYRLEADRQEEWRNGRLVAFSSTTEKNGKTTTVQGRAEGDRFVVEGPRGRATAPAEVWPANPWSPEILRAPKVIGTSTGRLLDVQVSGGGEDTISIRGQEIPAAHYRVFTDESNDLWFDRSGRLVKFTATEDKDLITLTLQ